MIDILQIKGQENQMPLLLKKLCKVWPLFKNPIEIVSPVSRFSTPHKPSNELFKLHWRNHLCMEINHRCHRIEMHQKIYMVTWIHMIDLEEEMTFQQFWLELQSTYLTCFKFISFFPFPFVTIKPIVKLGVQTIRHVYI